LENFEGSDDRFQVSAEPLFEAGGKRERQKAKIRGGELCLSIYLCSVGISLDKKDKVLGFLPSDFRLLLLFPASGT
jgi:hypothetical protein